jgi:hypothetical protein
MLGLRRLKLKLGPALKADTLLSKNAPWPLFAVSDLRPRTSDLRPRFSLACKSKGENKMPALDEVDRIIFEKVSNLPDNQKREVLSFIEFLQIKQDKEFIDYVNEITTKTLKDKQAKKKFLSLNELQAEYDRI